jgi:putative transcriptional regulator
VVIRGSGGIRKVRFGFGARGKSGGARIIYLFSGESLPAFVLAVFAKSEKVNLSAAERNALAKFVTEMVETYRRSKMTRTAFDKITAGLDDAKAFLDGSGKKRGYGIHVPARVNVKKIRMRLGLSQESFAQTYGFALSAVRDWEQGRRQPERSARILLKVVEKEPEAVTRALAKSA